jgi:hypothetical protein
LLPLIDRKAAEIMLPYSLLKVEAVDVIFLTGAILGAVVLVFISNPLTSWVNRLVKKKDDQDQKR